jgi:hypothetical protein
MHMLQSLFYLRTPLYVSGVTITHLQEHKTTVTKESSNRYFVIELDRSHPNIPQTSTSGTHAHRQHTATYQISNLTTQTSREVSNSTKHERRPPEDGQTIVTETCMVLMMCFTNIFNNLGF